MTHTMATPRRAAVGLSAVVLGVLVVTGCSSTAAPKINTSTPAGNAGATTSAPGSSGPSSPAATTSSSSSASTGGGGGGGISLGSGSFCSIAKKVQAQEESSTAALGDSAADLKTLLTQATQELSQFEAIAPSAIKGDVQTVATAEKTFFDAIATANYDITKISPSVLGEFNTPAVMTATDHITSYLETQCGIVEPSDDSSS